jgi:hypothetical protein
MPSTRRVVLPRSRIQFGSYEAPRSAWALRRAERTGWLRLREPGRLFPLKRDIENRRDDHYSTNQQMTRIRIIKRCTWGRFAPTPALWGASSSYRPVRAMAVRKCSKCFQLFSCISWACAFHAGGDASVFFSWLAEAEGGTSVLSRRAGSSEISLRILSLVKKTLRRHRAGFEPQRASSFVKRVKGPKYSEKSYEP